MTKTKLQSLIFRIPLLACLLVLGLFLAGCKPNADNDQSKSPEPPKQTQPQLAERIELKPDTSDEFQRIHRTFPNGTKHSLQIDYRDGTTKVEFYRLDGTVKEVKEYHPHLVDKLKSITVYDTKGDPIKKEGFRVNGNLESETEYLANGQEKITLYRIDGKRLHSVTLDAKDGTKHTTYYRQDGKSLWAEAQWHGTKDVTVEYYDDQGVHTHTLHKTSNSKTITVFNGAGHAKYIQHYTGYWSDYSYYSYSSFQLNEVEEFGADGETLERRISVERYSNKRVSKLEYFEDGDLVREQELHWDGSLKSERTLQDDGTWDSKSHSQGEQESDPVDPTVLEEPAYDDPLTNNPNNFL